ncbi:hypothetical protein SAMN05444359_10953 [Neolewinella agarilytica]|uniref:Uncharacterized protein n=1 Tax=Neolewinella agarilytica TaxID=478744 RepID=A0A1H9FPJ4_9BACT|nr:hypothetical protein SAMN05444359_10953 [Neolewinella agarilytica]
MVGMYMIEIDPTFYQPFDGLVIGKYKPDF